MSDEELIAWLRDLNAVLGKEAFACAADRIEELGAKLAKAVEGLEAALRYNSAMHRGAAAYNKHIKDIIAEIKEADPMSDHDLIRRGDAREALREVDAWTMPIAHAIRALPPAKQDDLASGKAVTVGVKPLVWSPDAMKGSYPDRLRAVMPCGSGDYSVTGSRKQDKWQWFRNGYFVDGHQLHAPMPLDAAKAAAQADYEARILAALEPVAAPDHAAIREAWEKVYWRMRSYAIHDNDCKLNKPPHFDGPCSCGLTAALEEALALIPKGAAEPTEYERKVAQMKKDFPNGI